MNIFSDNFLNKSDTSNPTIQPILNKRHISFLAVACALTISNLYYMQPLLATIAQDFGVSEEKIGFLSVLTQIGYACGLLLIAPLGDKYNQRNIVLFLLVAVTLSLSSVALAPTLDIVAVASFFVGFTTVIPQIIIPYTTRLTKENIRGKVVGVMLSALAIGILLSRTISGIIASIYSWKIMYWIAASSMLLLGVFVFFLLPSDRAPKDTPSYPALIASLWETVQTESILREACLFGALMFAAFNSFWVTLSIYLLTSSYHYSSEITGLFGLTGIFGAIAAPSIGRFADRYNPRYITGLAIIISLISLVLLWLMNWSLLSFIFGIILLELGIQACQVSNQSRIHKLSQSKRSRYNTIYMFTYFIGGAAGSLLGTYGWRVAKWNGVCMIIASLLLLALVWYWISSKKIGRTQWSI
ncbi:MFS transporter [Tengunoibacter tsumagoiensis]|uniref:Permease n=1 Tax=Tengunoibacter tsumagoiensis TaxID=2014871 RepID=A0A402A9Q0_9CHLR|nr:MFS transporter [Tengunoibacter tsumagoiensis]GCE15681.1 permease [Tengunoibacter tsumagoiensis]